MTSVRDGTYQKRQFWIHNTGFRELIIWGADIEVTDQVKEHTSITLFSCLFISLLFILEIYFFDDFLISENCVTFEQLYFNLFMVDFEDV
jgi:hypothetical protein